MMFFNSFVLFYIAVVCFIRKTVSFRQWSSYQGQVKLFSSPPQWLQRDYVTNIKLETEDVPSLFDSESMNGEEYSFQHLTLRELSESHKFSLDYLGDFCIECGAKSPLDIDKPIGDFMVGNQIESLITALNSLDPVETNLEYDGPSVFDLAYQLDVAPRVVLDICSKENFNLPFGKDTVLHESLVTRLGDIISARRDPHSE